MDQTNSLGCGQPRRMESPQMLAWNPRQMERRRRRPWLGRHPDLLLSLRLRRTLSDDKQSLFRRHLLKCQVVLQPCSRVPDQTLPMAIPASLLKRQREKLFRPYSKSYSFRPLAVQVLLPLQNLHCKRSLRHQRNSEAIQSLFRSLISNTVVNVQRKLGQVLATLSSLSSRMC